MRLLHPAGKIPINSLCCPPRFQSRARRLPLRPRPPPSQGQVTKVATGRIWGQPRTSDSFLVHKMDTVTRKTRTTSLPLLPTRLNNRHSTLVSLELLVPTMLYSGNRAPTNSLWKLRTHIPTRKHKVVGTMTDSSHIPPSPRKCQLLSAGIVRGESACRTKGPYRVLGECDAFRANPTGGPQRRCRRHRTRIDTRAQGRRRRHRSSTRTSRPALRHHRATVTKNIHTM